MKGIYLKFFAYEFQKYKGILVYEWLLEFAKKHGIQGGSAFRGIAGFGRYGNMHEEHFFELTSDVPVAIVFILNKEQSSKFLNLLKEENTDLFYITIPVEYGSLSKRKS